MADVDHTLALIAALVQGDRWLNADATAVFLGLTTPKLVPTKIVEPRWVQGKNGLLPRWANQTDSGQNKLTPSENRWLERSKTYPGVAAAFGQWAEWLKGDL